MTGVTWRSGVLRFWNDDETHLVWGEAKGVEVIRGHVPADKILVVSIPEEVCGPCALAKARREPNDLARVWFHAAGSDIRHPPFELKDSDLRPDDEILLRVQHVKHSAMFGVVRYHEAIAESGVVSRELGVRPGADVIVENSVDSSLLWMLSPEGTHGFGGAKVRARSQAALVLLASVYTSTIGPTVASQSESLTPLADLLRAAWTLKIGEAIQTMCICELGQT